MKCRSIVTIQNVVTVTILVVSLAVAASIALAMEAARRLKAHQLVLELRLVHVGPGRRVCLEGL